jgi:uncharacterized membrane protein HdeD (DUF308 family)
VRHWWAFLLRGIIFILLGVYMLWHPAGSLAALGFLFGLIVLFTGTAELLRVYFDRDHSRRVWHLILGIIDVIIGIMLMGHVAASATLLSIIVGFWFLFGGISMLSLSFISGKSWLTTIGGVLTILFGLLILFNPIFGAVTIVLWTAIAFITIGLFNVLLGFRLKG